MRPTGLLLLATLGLVGLLAAPAGAEIAPAANQFGPGREDFRYTLNPGGRIEDGVAVVNDGDAPLSLRAEGEVGAWVDLDATVGPGEAVEVPFVLAAPEGAAAGDHLGAIVAGRERLPIRLRLSGPLEPRLAVEDVRLGGGTVTYTVRNTGNATLGAKQRVAVSGPFGLASADAEPVPDTPELLPGETWKMSVPVPALRVTAKVTVLPLLTDAAGSTAPLAAITASDRAVPWVLLVVPLVLVGGAVLALRRRRVRV